MYRPKIPAGQTLNDQLEDKAKPVASHVHWAIRNCNGSEDKLRRSLLNIVRHYKNDYSNCSSSSHCRNDPNYEPSRLVITDPHTEILLQAVLFKSVLYVSAEDYILGPKGKGRKVLTPCAHKKDKRLVEIHQKSYKRRSQ